MRQEVIKKKFLFLLYFVSKLLSQECTMLSDLLTRPLVILCTGMFLVLPNLISTSANAIASIVSGIDGRRNYLTFRRGRNSLGTVSSHLPLSVVYIHSSVERTVPATLFCWGKQEWQ